MNPIILHFQVNCFVLAEIFHKHETMHITYFIGDRWLERRLCFLVARLCVLSPPANNKLTGEGGRTTPVVPLSLNGEEVRTKSTKIINVKIFDENFSPYHSPYVALFGSVTSLVSDVAGVTSELTKTTGSSRLK